jgi:alkyl sulfatase BDS1-like metallo-beta-lactamase superfamily hydrolase
MNTAPKPATAATVRAHAALAATLPEDTGGDFADARRGFIATVPDGRITDAEGRVFWNMGAFDFEADPADGPAPCPPTVNPSLWRQARLNLIHGLFEVTPGVYQVRGFDLSNITFIEGETGWIVIDPLISSQTAAAALWTTTAG